ncbi:hypothetical protein PS013_23885, partial [Shigella sonnei]|nr:hypothetical protein [Shigella sonnei]
RALFWGGYSGSLNSKSLSIRNLAINIHIIGKELGKHDSRTLLISGEAKIPYKLIERMRDEAWISFFNEE